eukprot:scaffold8931_cov65-Phaeocystis_antarctica.AAC.1
MNRPATKRGLTSGAPAVFVSAPSTTSHKTGGRRRGRRRLGRGGLADALPVRGARASVAATIDEEVGGLEVAAWRIVRACGRYAVKRGLVGQVERRGGGIALAL